RELLEHRGALLCRQPTEVELVVRAQEMDPLRRVRLLRRLLQRPRERPDITGGERIEQPLVDGKIEHELQSVALRAEVFQALVGWNVRLGEQHGIAAS